MIDPHFWESADVIKVDVFARYVFMSMFSHADDEGRNIGSAVYIRNITFPREEVPLAKVKRAIDAIKEHLSVVFYEISGETYYQLTKWNDWQKVDHPSKSLIPALVRDSLANDSRSVPQNIAPNIKEDNIKESKIKENNAPARARGSFLKPSIEEVKAYCDERKNGIDPEAFINFYESKGWMIGKNKMKEWKAAVRTWEQKRKEEGRASPPPKVDDETARKYSDWGKPK
jgi:hypothetical protein